MINDDVAFDGEAIVSADGCELIFCSNRLSGTADWEIYSARVVAP